MNYDVGAAGHSKPPSSPLLFRVGVTVVGNAVDGDEIGDTVGNPVGRVDGIGVGFSVGDELVG